MPTLVKRQATSRALILDPASRLRHLSEHGSTVEIDFAIPIKRYFRSGSEMERQVRWGAISNWASQELIARRLTILAN